MCPLNLNKPNARISPKPVVPSWMTACSRTERAYGSLVTRMGEF